MKSNFTFLDEKFPMLANLGDMAEQYLYSDPNSCLIKLGLFAETIVNLMMKMDEIRQPESENTHANRIKLLKKEGLINQQIDDIFYALRKARNKAVHEGYSSQEDSLTMLTMAHNLGNWFMETYGDWEFVSKPFETPEVISQDKDIQLLLAEKEVEIASLSSQIEALAVAEKVSSQERIKRASVAADKMSLSESETRYLIDEQLRKVGWEADTVRLRYSKGTRPRKGRDLAIAEWPTDNPSGRQGYADYALFTGLELVGVVEAKRIMTDIPSVLDHQCKEYAKSIKDEHKEYLIGEWNGHKVPFLFATNGRKYLKQLETKSGIWFLDTRKPSNIPKAQQGWMSPRGLTEMLEQDIEGANQALEEMTYDLLRDKDGLNLRDYQIEAIDAAEKAILEGKNTVLLSMATGTGKTRTVLGMIYRFLKTGRFKRVLFLVDRSALGEQAQDVFKEVKIEELMTLNAIYEIRELDDKTVDKETKVHVATVQGLVKRILYNEGDTIPSVTDYDLIVVDEAVILGLN